MFLSYADHNKLQFKLSFYMLMKGNATRYKFSHHHPQHKHSVVRTLMDRAKNIPSTEEEASRETKRVAKALATNNYPANFIHNGRQLNRRQEMNDTDQRGLVILPYAQGFSEKVAKVLRGFNIKVAHKPIRTISNILKKPKDKIETERGFQRNRIQDQM